jgi:signal-transduction protein with cAMP-binding, CBS, and nucleotidyltransferase domain
MEKVAHTRVVAVAKYGFAFEMLLVMSQLILNINKLSIKLVFFGILRLIQILVGHRD